MAARIELVRLHVAWEDGVIEQRADAVALLLLFVPCDSLRNVGEGACSWRKAATAAAAARALRTRRVR